MLDKKEIEGIVDKSFYDCGYKKKYTKQYYIDLVNNTMQNINWNEKSKEDANDDDVENKIKEDGTEEKCSKPHITSLPYDNRTSDLDKLQKRLDTIDERMDDLQEEHFALTSDIESLSNLIKKHDKSYEELQEEAFESVKSIQDRFNEELQGYDLGKATINGRPNQVYSEINGLTELFEYSSMIMGDEANHLNEIAGQIVDFAYEQTGGDDTPWSNRVIGIADDIRALANKHNVNNNPQGNELDEFFNANGTLDNLYAEDRKNRSMYNDYKSERIKTKDRISQVKKNN